jgi:hypothetical protein
MIIHLEEETGERKCQWPGCSEKAEIYFEGCAEGEHLCAQHTTKVLLSLTLALPLR